MRKLGVVDADVNEIANPVWRKFHESSFLLSILSALTTESRRQATTDQTIVSGKLPQKTHVSLKEQLNVIDAVLQDCDAIDTHAKCEARDFFRIVSVVLYEFEDVRIHHAAPENLDPTCHLARTVGLAASLSTAAADETAHHHL